jgi:hypothetical protein
MSSAWLPPLVVFKNYATVEEYGEVLYAFFKTDFLDSLPAWPEKRVGLKRLPLMRGKEATFWHFLTDGEDEEARQVDFLRCERIRWPRPVIEAFTNRQPTATDRVIWWKNKRKLDTNFLIALPDFSYLFVVRDQGEYVLPWTQYVLIHDHQRKKNADEYTNYWATRT